MDKKTAQKQYNFLIKEGKKRGVVELKGSTKWRKYKGFIVHHIKPRSIFPELNLIPENMVKLSNKEHYIAHYLLTFIYPCHGTIGAFAFMRKCGNEEEYEN